MGGNLTFNDNDDVQLKGATDLTLIGNVSDSLKTSVSYSDVGPATQNITALDSGTSTLSGANSQVFYFGSPTANSAASFSLSSVESVTVQANLIGAGGTMVVEVSMDGGSFWLRPNVYQISTQSYTNGFTAPFIAVVNTAGMTNIRVRSTVSWTGTATIILRESLNSRAVTILDALPTGANTIGSLNNISGTISLPTGATTAALQTTGNSSLSSIDTKLTGVATAANQSTEITSLQLMDNPIGSVAAGTAGTSSYLIGGVYNTTLPTPTNGQQVGIQLDSSGRVLTSTTLIDGAKTSYSASVSGLVTVATATDVFTITGSGTKTVRITRIEISASSSAGGGVGISMSLIKRSSANTGGTSASVTRVPHDSTNAAPTATVLSYTINPTVLGTSLGNVRASRYDAAVSGASNTPLIWDFGDRPSQAVVLRGTSELLCVNFGSTTVTGPLVSISVEWTEE